MRAHNARYANSIASPARVGDAILVSKPDRSGSHSSFSAEEGSIVESAFTVHVLDPDYATFT